jgi:hypothetical protein
MATSTSLIFGCFLTTAAAIILPFSLIAKLYVQSTIWNPYLANILRPCGLRRNLAKLAEPARAVADNATG